MVGSLYQVQECQIGGLSSRRGRGRGLSLLIPTTTPPSTLPQPLGRGFPPSSSPNSLPPLQDCSPPRRHQEAPLRQPCTMPHCVQPHSHFPAPTPYAFHDPNAPPYFEDLFPPIYNTLCLCVTASVNPNSDISPQSLSSRPPPPYLIPSHNQSLMTLMCFPQIPLIMIVIWIGICNPSPHTPLYLSFFISLHTTCSNLKKINYVDLRSTSTMSEHPDRTMVEYGSISYPP